LAVAGQIELVPIRSPALCCAASGPLAILPTPSLLLLVEDAGVNSAILAAMKGRRDYESRSEDSAWDSS
jgi:hypothetical protein